MKKIKTLHIITRFDKGGSAENTYLTLMGLSSEKYELHLMKGTTKGFRVTQKEKDQIDINLNNLKAKGIKTHTENLLIRNISPPYDLLALIKIFIHIKKEKYHIVHTHTSKGGLLGRWAAYFAQAPIIIHTPHGHVFHNYFSKLKTRIIIFLEQASSLITDKIITLTNKSRDDHIDLKIAKTEKFITIHSGIDFEKLIPSISISCIKNDLKISKDRLVVGTIGRLVPVKGHTYLIDAAKVILEKIPHVQFLFLGDGELKNDLSHQAKNLEIEDHIHFLGWRSDVAEVLSIFDLFVLPSLNEGMGKVLVEAMFLKKAIVASHVGGIPNLVTHNKNGLLVPPKDPGKLAEMIIILLSDKQARDKMGMEGRKQAENYSSVKMVKEIEKLYDALIEKNLT